MRLPLLAVVALALLAGCSGFVDSSAERTVTPAPVPESTGTPEVESDVAPGVGGGRVINADRLARAHRRAVQNRSYQWTERHRSTRFGTNESITVTTQLRVQHELLYRYRLSTSWSYANTSEYTAGSLRYRREVGRSGYRYTMEPSTTVTARFGGEPERAISRYLSIGAATVAATRIDGQRYYRITGTTDAIPETGQISNYSVRALVAPSGFVRSLTVGYDDVIGENHEQIGYRFRYADVDETRVHPPEWIDDRWPEQTLTAVNGTETEG